MKIPYRWLKEFVETDLDARAVADRLTNAGIGVEQITPVVEGLSGVVVGEIEAIERDLGVSAAGHQNRLVRVALPGRHFQVVCGAPNAAPGLRAAFAPPGARLPGVGEVKAAKIRGVVSEGILCSEKELGLSDDHGGILVLPAEAPLGADLSPYLGLDDWILDIEITPNRPDALSVVGVAREIAALTGAPFRFPRVLATESEPDASTLAAVDVQAPDLCPRFCARVITGLTVKPSPPWLAQRLRAVGLRPINNLVDVTNYIMWELGQPLHAFDLDTLARHTVVVRRAQPGERIKTLDGQERALGPDMAMVCDPEHAVGIGGVMGGADSEVTAGHDAGAPRGGLLGSRLHPPHRARAVAHHRRGLPLRARRRHRGAPRRPGPRRPAHGRARRGHGRARRDRRLPRAAAAPTARRSAWPGSSASSGRARRARKRCASCRPSASRWTTPATRCRWWCRASAATSTRRTTWSRRSSASGATTRSP